MPRLRRLREIFPDQPISFVTACTQDRRHLLAFPEVKQAVEEFGSVGPELGAWLGSYVLMPDHVHAFVVLDAQRCDLPRWMKAFKAAIGRAIRERGVNGVVWQKGFFDHVLRNSESASEKWAYVRANPLRAGLVAAEDEWPFWGQVHPLRSDDCDR